MSRLLRTQPNVSHKYAAVTDIYPKLVELAHCQVCCQTSQSRDCLSHVCEQTQTSLHSQREAHRVVTVTAKKDFHTDRKDVHSRGQTGPPDGGRRGRHAVRRHHSNRPMFPAPQCAQHFTICFSSSSISPSYSSPLPPFLHVSLPLILPAVLARPLALRSILSPLARPAQRGARAVICDGSWQSIPVTHASLLTGCRD